jgi:hypothetical protein
MQTTTTETAHHRRRVPHAVRAGLALTATALLVAAGCGGDDGGGSTAAGSGGGGGSGSGDLTVSIAAPDDGATVGSSFDVEVDTSEPIGEPDTGRHHVHLYYDGNTAEGEYDIAYKPDVTVDGLSPGQHTIEAVVANADHSLTDARDEITVTVDAAAAAGGAGATDTTGTTDTTDDDDSGYGY